MFDPSERRLYLRYMFRVLGLILIFLGWPVVTHVLQIAVWQSWLCGNDTRAALRLLALAHLYILLTGLFCLVTARGLRRNRFWASGVGICTSVLLLIGLPWLTILGGIGLYVLLDPKERAVPAGVAVTTKPTTDFWAAKRKSKAQEFVLTVFGIAIWPLLVWFFYYAHRAGMPAWRPGLIFWVWLSVFAILNTTLHESGHAIVAWAAGFHLRVVSIGPFTFVRDHTRFRFRFNLGKLFETGGYMGAVPVSEHNLRLYQIAVTAAGPLTNVITCLVCLDIFFSLPGTEYQSLWWIAAFNAVLAGVYAVSNLIPLGYCDGSMLLHLILWTPAGRLLADHHILAQMREEADACHGRADFAREIELKEARLQRSLAYGRDNAFMIAACRQSLGSAYMLFQDWPAAEFQYRKCQDLEAEMAANPALASNVWSGLHLALIRRHHVAEARTAYTTVVDILEKRKAAKDSPAGPAVTLAMLAQAHLHSGAFEAALKEIGPALNSLPRDSSRMSLYGHLLRSKAVCLLNLGDTEAGLAAAKSAADVFRSPENPPLRRNLGWEDVADLGSELWRAGQSALPIELLREAIGQLESGAATTVAANYRIKLTSILRQLGRLNEARAELPAERAITANTRRAFLTERAQIHLVSGAADLAIADCRELVDLWRAHPCAPPNEIACAEALLAKACLAGGQVQEADTLALHAADVLGPLHHPLVASCLITLALVRAQSDSQQSAAMIAEAYRLIDALALLGPAEKARLKDAETARIEQSAVAVTA
jgi:Zn-dependent protease/tetratricopeptide (TPR) repeat protein